MIKNLLHVFIMQTQVLGLLEHCLLLFYKSFHVAAVRSVQQPTADRKVAISSHQLQLLSKVP